MRKTLSLNPYQIIKSRYVTEKSVTLSQLHTSESNASVKKCQSPKYTFLVHKEANKIQIKRAIEEIYNNKNVKVVDVNTITIRPKKKRVRGKPTYGKSAAIKKAIVTFEAGDVLED